MRATRAERRTIRLDPLFTEEERRVRQCDHPGCPLPGEHRAPKAPDRLNDYYWFCLDHVRDYNKAWNFCAGLSDNEVEALIRADTCWQRPSWPIGSWQAAEQKLRDRVFTEFRSDDVPPGGARGDDRNGGFDRNAAPKTEAERALDVLNLSAPVDLAAVKARYKALVKQHHPDANGGDRDAEERLKSINHAYSTLKALFAV